MAGNIAAIVLDVDGTLYDRNKTVSPATVAALSRAQQAFGCRIVLASSRMPRSLRGIAGGLGLDCDLVAFDGSMCVRSAAVGGEVCLEATMRGYDRALLAEAAGARDLFASVYNGDRWFASNEGRWLDRELMGGDIVPDSIGRAAIVGLIEQGTPLSKVMFRGEDAGIAAVLAQRVALFGAAARGYSNRTNIVEFLPSGASKSAGVAAVLGMPAGRLTGVVAFGDGHNDVELLAAAEISVAMGNAIEACKAKAKFVTADNNSDGIAVFLDRMLKYGRT